MQCSAPCMGAGMHLGSAAPGQGKTSGYINSLWTLCRHAYEVCQYKDYKRRVELAKEQAQ